MMWFCGYIPCEHSVYSTVYHTHTRTHARRQARTHACTRTPTHALKSQLVLLQTAQTWANAGVCGGLCACAVGGTYK